MERNLSHSNGDASSREAPTGDASAGDATAGDGSAPYNAAPEASDASAPGDSADEASTNGDAATLGAVQEPQRLHPMTLVQRVVSSLPALAVILFPVLTSSNSQSWVSLFLGLAYGLFALPAIVLQYLRFSYRITPKQIVIQSGVFNRKNRSIPVERVQNIQIEQPLLARLTGTAKLQIETAGSSATEGSLEYVGLDEAHRIRRTIRSLQRQQRDDAASPSPDEADATATEDGAGAAADVERESLFAMSLGRVLLSGAFRFSLLYIALIFSALQFVNPDTIVNWVARSRLESVMETATRSPWLTGFATILLASLLSWLTGIAVNLNKYYGFKLWLEGDKLQKRHGLLTLAEGTIPLDKVQTLIVRTNPVMRAFGWYALEVQTVGVDVEEQGHRVVVPFARRSTVLEMAQRIRSFALPDDFEPVSPVTIRRIFLRYTAAWSAVVSGVAYFAWSPAWWGLAAAPLILLYAYLHYREHGYAVQEDGFFVRRGVFVHYLWIIPTEKHHVFYTTASVFQRRLALKTLYVDTAGAAAFSYPEVIDLPAEEADAQLHRLKERFQTLYAERIRAQTGDASARLSRSERPRLPATETS
jgi:putative membrane protein